MSSKSGADFAFPALPCCRPATFQALGGHTWPAVALLGDTTLEQSRAHCKETRQGQHDASVSKIPRPQSSPGQKGARPMYPGACRHVPGRIPTGSRHLGVSVARQDPRSAQLTQGSQLPDHPLSPCPAQAPFLTKRQAGSARVPQVGLGDTLPGQLLMKALPHVPGCASATGDVTQSPFS